MGKFPSDAQPFVRLPVGSTENGGVNPHLSEARRVTGTGVRQRTLIGVAAATRMMANILMGTVLAVYIGRRGSPFAVSLVMTAYWFGLMFFAPIWGAVADVTGRRRAVVIVTGSMATLAILPLTVIDRVWISIGLRAVYAVFAAGFLPVLLSIVSVYGGRTGRGRSIGFFNSATAAGFTLAQLTAGVLLGLLVPFEVLAVVAGVSAVATLVLVWLADPTPTPSVDPTVDELVRAIKRRLLPGVADRAHLRTHGLRWLYVALAIRNMTVLGIGSLLPPYLIEGVGVSTLVMGILLAINPAGQTAFMYVFGRIADTIGRKPLIVGGMAASGVYALVVASAGGSGPLALRIVVAGGAFVLLGAAYSAMTTGALAFIGDVVPPSREAEMMGLRSTAKGLGGVLGPALIGALATLFGYQFAFATASLLAFLAAGLAAFSLTESRSTGGTITAPE